VDFVEFRYWSLFLNFLSSKLKRLLIERSLRDPIAYLVKKGALKRVYPRTYRFAEYEPKVDFQWENLGFLAASIAEGVICLISALCYYELKDQVMREIWIAVTHECYAPKRPNRKIIRMRNSSLGKTHSRSFA
jgi:predicted transcriptional regulator of viral defense system